MTPALRRYTQLPFLIDYLQSGQLTLLNPDSWDDRNDAFYILKFLEARGFKSGYALCLAEAMETYHHWKIFSHGTSGVCIEFDKEKFSEYASEVAGLRAELVKYCTIEQMRENLPTQSDFPFIKRVAFSDEREFRLFLPSHDESSKTYGVKMPLNSINRITLSPWLAKSVSENIKRMLKMIQGCERLEIYRSTLVENEAWKNFANLE